MEKEVEEKIKEFGLDPDSQTEIEKEALEKIFEEE